MKESPKVSEYDAYFEKYVNLVPKGDIVQQLEEQHKETDSLLNELTDAQGLFRYSPEKWSIKEVIGHLIDTERILTYTLLCTARGEPVPLPRYDKDVYIQHAEFDKQSMKGLLAHFATSRKATMHLLQSLQSKDWVRTGIALNSKVTVRAYVYILAGHELHHRKIIKGLYIGSSSFPE
ncbi:damage-inducible protein DinB [Bacillus sp. SA1-12]|uniref:DinB family protein n=1 Tax=Bacillus sp. SA1-12 TaxID=1455638 RepID=UPI00062555FA|nr:DinB family protein [Bacillus sp. SA1-12]KKI94141.1 damage-inducible protein DinB [Bacillus sp. SA1-12]